MLVFDLHTIGNKLLIVRKRMGMTQAEVAESAGLSDRTYADIERGTVNMRIETILKIFTYLRKFIIFSPLYTRLILLTCNSQSFYCKTFWFCGI